jgi:phage tail-like protein
MARAETTDFLQNFRFHVTTSSSGYNPLKFNQAGTGTGGEAGFQSVSIPDISIEATEYREGTYKYTRKFPGPPTIADITLIRGVIVQDTKFYDWAVNTYSGGQYRVDLNILQYTRSDLATPQSPAQNSTVPTTASRIYKCYECLPTQVKPAGDLDATSGEVAMAELTVAMEYFTISNTAPAALVGTNNFSTQTPTPQ